jgi:hypothetical protein
VTPEGAANRGVLIDRGEHMKSRFRLRQTKLIVIGVIGAAIIAGTAIAANLGDSKSEHWGIIDRNTIGSPVGQLRDGPYSNASTGGISAPPYGKGSLGITVGDGQEKVAFGDETDFVGAPVSAINAVGYSVFRTGEDVGYGGPDNLPNITFEVDPNITPSVNYSSLVWNPDGSSVPVNEWSGYIDATTNGYWYFTNGSTATATGCTQAGSCTSFADVQAGLASAGSSGATILSVAIAKGRDSQFQGDVDGLRLNDKIYDFEADGVHTKGAPH